MAQKIAITVTQPGDLDMPMDSRFGRAPALLLVDPDTEEAVSMENEATCASHGAGPATASTLNDHQVTAVISGRYGPKAYEALQALGIEMWAAPEGLTSREALARFQNGELRRFGVRTIQ